MSSASAAITALIALSRLSVTGLHPLAGSHGLRETLYDGTDLGPVIQLASRREHVPRNAGPDRWPIAVPDAKLGRDWIYEISEFLCHGSLTCCCRIRLRGPMAEWSVVCSE